MWLVLGDWNGLWIALKLAWDYRRLIGELNWNKAYFGQKLQVSYIFAASCFQNGIHGVVLNKICNYWVPNIELIWVKALHPLPLTHTPTHPHTKTSTLHSPTPPSHSPTHPHTHTRKPPHSTVLHRLPLTHSLTHPHSQSSTLHSPTPSPTHTLTHTPILTNLHTLQPYTPTHTHTLTHTHNPPHFTAIHPLPLTHSPTHPHSQTSAPYSPTPPPTHTLALTPTLSNLHIPQPNTSSHTQTHHSHTDPCD